jgi:hypothetical protein
VRQISMSQRTIPIKLWFTDKKKPLGRRGAE